MIITAHDGELRAILEDHQDVPELCRDLGAFPDRASSIELVRSGRFRGYWYVDFSPLADSLADPTFNCCLVQCFRTRAEALAAEVQWLKINFLGVQDG